MIVKSTVLIRLKSQSQRKARNNITNSVENIPP